MWWEISFAHSQIRWAAWFLTWFKYNTLFVLLEMRRHNSDLLFYVTIVNLQAIDSQNCNLNLRTFLLNRWPLNVPLDRITIQSKFCKILELMAKHLHYFAAENTMMKAVRLYCDVPGKSGPFYIYCNINTFVTLYTLWLSVSWLLITTWKRL